jgi:hypothetical protein
VPVSETLNCAAPVSKTLKKPVRVRLEMTPSTMACWRPCDPQCLQIEWHCHQCSVNHIDEMTARNIPGVNPSIEHNVRFTRREGQYGGLPWKGFGVLIGIEHACAHPATCAAGYDFCDRSRS